MTWHLKEKSKKDSTYLEQIARICLKFYHFSQMYPKAFLAKEHDKYVK